MDLLLPAGMEPLPRLKKASDMWSEDISEFVDEILRNPLSFFIQSKVDGICIDGRPIRQLLDPAKLKDFMAIIKLTVDTGDNARELLQDVVSILCVTGAMCGDLKGYFQGNDAEETWRKLLSKANMIREEVASSYERNRDLYDTIFEGLSQLIPPNLAFCIRVAASIVCALWPYRHQIALWIAANWQAVAIGIGGGLLAAGVIALAAYGLYKVFADDDNDGKRDRRNSRSLREN